MICNSQKHQTLKSGNYKVNWGSRRVLNGQKRRIIGRWWSSINQTVLNNGGNVAAGWQTKSFDFDCSDKAAELLPLIIMAVDDVNDF
jgi:hypothetical protein